MTTWLRLILVTATVGGGFAGFIITFQALTSSSHSILNYLLLVVFMAVYIGITAAGLLFVHDPTATRALSIALAIQTVWVSSPLFLYNLYAGLCAVPKLGLSHQGGDWSMLVNFEFFFGSGFKFQLLQDNPWYIGLNLFPFVLLFLVLKYADPFASRSTPKSSDLGLLL